jgi:hypothetical protein
MVAPLKRLQDVLLKRAPIGSILLEMEETVETVEGVQVKMVEGRLGDSTGVTTVVEDGTCNEVEGTVGERHGDDAETETDTIAAGVREGDEDEGVMIDDDAPEGVPSVGASGDG